MPHDRLSVLSQIQRQGVAPVFYDPDPEAAFQTVAACARGGAHAVEFTDRGDFAVDVFREVSRRCAREAPYVILGIGSIVEAPTAALYIAAGARFVVSPALNPEVARLCNRRMVAYVPGCGSATEISQAHELGCEIVKLFPGASVGGPDFVKNILGPMPWAKIMPTGGVEPDVDSLKRWFGAGVIAVGMGSRLLDPAAVKAGDWRAVESQVRDVAARIAQIREKD